MQKQNEYLNELRNKYNSLVNLKNEFRNGIKYNDGIPKDLKKFIYNQELNELDSEINNVKLRMEAGGLPAVAISKPEPQIKKPSFKPQEQRPQEKREYRPQEKREFRPQEKREFRPDDQREFKQDFKPKPKVEEKPETRYGFEFKPQHVPQTKQKEKQLKEYDTFIKLADKSLYNDRMEDGLVLPLRNDERNEIMDNYIYAAKNFDNILNSKLSKVKTSLEQMNKMNNNLSYELNLIKQMKKEILGDDDTKKEAYKNESVRAKCEECMQMFAKDVKEIDNYYSTTYLKDSNNRLKYLKMVTEKMNDMSNTLRLKYYSTGNDRFKDELEKLQKCFNRLFNIDLDDQNPTQDKCTYYLAQKTPIDKKIIPNPYD